MNVNWMRPARLSDPIFLTSTLMMGVLQLQQLNCECFTWGRSSFTKLCSCQDEGKCAQSEAFDYTKLLSYEKAVRDDSFILRLISENTYQLLWRPSRTLICFQALV